MDCETITKQYLTRFIRTINGTSDTSNTLILILQNPAESDDIDDKTTKAIVKAIGRKYKTIIILNIIALVGKKLEDIPVNIIDKELVNIHDENLKIIKEVLNSNLGCKILLACGQHFIHNTVTSKVGKLYEQYFKDIYHILENFKERVYYITLSAKSIKINSKIISLPIHIKRYLSKLDESNFIQFI